MVNSMKAQNAEEERTLFGIVTVGRYSRFYQLARGATQLEDYSGSAGRRYEFEADEDEIDRMLMEFKQGASR